MTFDEAKLKRFGVYFRICIKILDGILNGKLT